MKTGNKVLFVGGPEAGNVRIVPEDHTVLKGDNDWLYQIWPVRMRGDKRVMYVAFDATKAPIEAFLEMWQEYSPAAQIRRDASEALTYQRVGGGPARK